MLYESKGSKVLRIFFFRIMLQLVFLIIFQGHNALYHVSIRIFHEILKYTVYVIRERRQLGFITLNGNLAVNLKPTYPPLLNGKGQFTFLKTKSSRSSGIVMYPPKFLMRILKMSRVPKLFWNCWVFPNQNLWRIKISIQR